LPDVSPNALSIPNFFVDENNIPSQSTIAHPYDLFMPYTARHTGQHIWNLISTTSDDRRISPTTAIHRFGGPQELQQGTLILQVSDKSTPEHVHGHYTGSWKPYRNSQSFA
jgi:hypothetical protein